MMGAMLYGPDVSSYQDWPDWAAVAASGRTFAWTKATEGLGYVNPYLARNWPAIRSAGLTRGAYHFGHGELDPLLQADFFLSHVPDLQPGDLLALDLEEGPGNLLQWALAFLGRVAQQVGFRPLLYSGRWFLDPHGVEGSADLAQYALWLSGYQANTPALPPGWSTLAMWQFTDASYIPGINGPCDESVFFGGILDLVALGKAGGAAPPLGPRQLAVNADSVIGDMTYPDGVDMDSLAPGQSASRRIFIRELVQYIKTLPTLPPDFITWVSVIGDKTYPDGGPVDVAFIRDGVQKSKAILGAS